MLYIYPENFMKKIVKCKNPRRGNFCKLTCPFGPRLISTSWQILSFGYREYVEKIDILVHDTRVKFKSPPFDKFRGPSPPPPYENSGGPQIAMCVNSNLILFCVFANYEFMKFLENNNKNSL